MTFVTVLLDQIKYPGCNGLVFGVNSNKAPPPIMVKQMLLVLKSVNILSHVVTVDTSTTKILASDKVSPVVIKAVLGYSHCQETNGIPACAMFDGYYWHRVKVIHSIVMQLFNFNIIYTKLLTYILQVPNILPSCC